jgi:hypothetical protein
MRAKGVTIRAWPKALGPLKPQHRRLYAVRNGRRILKAGPVERIRCDGFGRCGFLQRPPR